MPAYVGLLIRKLLPIFIIWTPSLLESYRIRYLSIFSTFPKKLFRDFVAFKASKRKRTPFLFIFWSQSLIVRFLDRLFCRKKLLGSPDLFFYLSLNGGRNGFFWFFFFENWWIFNLLSWILLELAFLFSWASLRGTRAFSSHWILIVTLH